MYSKIFPELSHCRPYIYTMNDFILKTTSKIGENYINRFQNLYILKTALMTKRKTLLPALVNKNSTN